jgi:ActR/RegA family two-component response regulator
MIEMGLNISEMARRLGRHRAAVHRELSTSTNRVPAEVMAME